MTHMTKPSGDSWAAGEAYEAYMGRWSRALARVFLQWLHPNPSGHWLEVGCGTGALTAAICDRCRPASVVACDPSEAFIEHARSTFSDACAFHVVTEATALPTRERGFDAVVSGLVLNFMPEPERALTVMRERSHSGGTVAAYIWDYAGVEFLRYFWDEAVALNASAAPLHESHRFGFWQVPALTSLFHAAGLVQVDTDVLEIPTDFADFEDYWKPFLGGSGPAPAYVASLDPTQRELLRARLEQRLPYGDDGQIRLRARALAVRGIR
jgi:trans-aconitate methyltransferase